jgi:hypothetical protein
MDLMRQWWRVRCIHRETIASLASVSDQNPSHDGERDDRIVRPDRRLDRHPRCRRPERQRFSFIGAVFDSPVIARVLITSGDAELSAAVNDLSAGGTKDLVVMDDFVYGEPQPLP